MSDQRPPLSSPPDPRWEAPTGPPIMGEPPVLQPPPGQHGMPGMPGMAPSPGRLKGPGNRVRPWWGAGDVLLIIPLVIGILILSYGVLILLAIAEGIPVSDIGSGDSSTLPASMVIVPTLILQFALFAWPFVVSKWKGLGPASDWGWAFKPVDLGIGLGTAMIALFAAGIAATITAALVGLEDDSQAENTQIITDVEGSPWLYVILFVVVIGAPFSEELLFRGLILRAFEKRWGVVVGVIASLLFFVPIHFADSGDLLGDGQLVLWASIAALGTVLAIAAVMTKRLAAPIVAHMIINGIGAAGALGYLDRLTDGLAS